MSEASLYGIEIIAGLIIIPWNVWVGVSIFALREEVHIMRAEVDLLREIKRLVEKTNEAH